MAEIVNNDGEIEALLAELQFLRQASQANTYDICRWCVDNHWCGEDAQRMFPKVWHLLEKRIREYLNEAREVDDDGKLPIHIVLDYSRRLRTNTAAPLSLVHLLIEVHPDGLHVLDLVGYIPLHSAVDHSCIDCFRAVLYNGVSRQQQFKTVMDGLPCTGALSQMLVLSHCGNYCTLTVIASLFRMFVAGRLWNF